MSAARGLAAGSIHLTLTNRVARESTTYALRDNIDFATLVTRLVTRVYGSAAAHARRNDLYSDANGLRRWDGIVLGRALTIIEVHEPQAAPAA